MDVKITAMDGVNVTGSIRLQAGDGTVGFYIAETTKAKRTEAPFYDFEMTLTSLSFPGDEAVLPEKVVVPIPLPVPPKWDVALTENGMGEVAYTVFGGGWNSLNVDQLDSGSVKPGYAYEVEEVNKPDFVQNTSKTAAKQQFVSAIFSGYQLGIIGLAGQETKVSGIVGASDAPVASGRVWGDLSGGLPTSLSVIYKVDKTEGASTADGGSGGNVSFATFDAEKFILGTPVPLLEGLQISDMDVAVAGDHFCLFAITGDGAPLLGLYDQTGKALGTPNMPVGSWSNAGRWVTNPTIVATPGSSVGFSFAFIEMNGDVPSGIYTGTLSSPEVTS